MKILLFTGYLDKKLNANNKIAYEIACELSKKNNDVTICGMSYHTEGTVIDENGVRAIYYHGDDFVSKAKSKLEKYVEVAGVSRSNAVKKFSLSHPFSALAIHYSYTPKYKDDAVIKKAVSVIEKLYTENCYDAVIAFQMPFWAEKAVADANTGNCKKCIYQLDPWGLHELDSMHNESPQQRIKDETSYFEKYDAVFTTPVLLKQYCTHDSYKGFTEKMHAMDFPNVKPIKTITDSPVLFDKNYINILFAGMIDDSYRNPRFFLENFEKLIKKSEKIRIYFLGNNLSSAAKTAKESHPNHVFCIDAVTPDKAFAAMEACDFMLNISNTISNQVPSKIFDYFSLGKPIINVQKIENCPAQEYMEKYPLCFNMKEFENRDCSESLLEFIGNSKGKKAEFEKIKEIYRTATPEYVADRIIEVISNL